MNILLLYKVVHTFCMKWIFRLCGRLLQNASCALN